jgi:hypothetical protein
MHTHPNPTRYLELDALLEAIRWPVVDRRTIIPYAST